MFPVALGFAISKVRQYVASFFADTIQDIGSAAMDSMESGFDKLMFIFDFFIPLITGIWNRFIFTELTTFCISSGNNIIGAIEHNFGSMTSLSFLYYLVGLSFLVFCIKQLCKLIGSLL